MDSNYDSYYNYIRSFYNLSKKDFDQLLSHSKPLQLKAKATLVEMDKKPESIYLLVKGVVRSFVILENGKEITKTLFSDMELCSSLTALIRQEPSKIIYETLTECYILELNYKKFKELCNTNIEILKLYVNYLEELYSLNEVKHLDVLSKDAKARYLELRERIPDIDNLIPQYQIAAFINVTPVQLSRIRASLK